MQERIEKACRLTLEELRQVIFSKKWAKAPHAQKTSIKYTFDTKTIPRVVEESLQWDYPRIKMSALSQAAIGEVNKSLALWQSTCDDRIDFNYKDTLAPNEPGITIIGCDNMNLDTGANIRVKDTPSPHFLGKVVVCIPSQITSAVDKKTVAHEIGHAIGIKHVHEIESIKQRLMQTKQGQICSVMSYEFMLESPISDCTTTEYCADEHYTIIPGPMDKQICAHLYSPPSFSQQKYFHAVCLGFLNGSMEKAIASLLEHLNFINIGKENANNISLVISALLRANKAQPNDIGNALLICELTARMHSFKLAYLLNLIRTMANIYFLFMQLFHMYGNEDNYVTALYLGTFLVSNWVGIMLAEPIGKKGAFVINKFVNSVESLFETGVSAYSKSTRCLPALKGFFSERDKDNPTRPSDDAACSFT